MGELLSHMVFFVLFMFLHFWRKKFPIFILYLLTLIYYFLFIVDFSVIQTVSFGVQAVHVKSGWTEVSHCSYLGVPYLSSDLLLMISLTFNFGLPFLLILHQPFFNSLPTLFPFLRNFFGLENFNTTLTNFFTFAKLSLFKVFHKLICTYELISSHLPLIQIIYSSF